MINRRRAVSTVLLAWLALAIVVPMSDAAAAEEKGIFSFFNRSQGDNADSSGPVHMKPNVAGSAYGGGPAPATQPLNLNPRATKTKTARFEDSPIHAEAAKVSAARDAAIQAEMMQTETRIKQQQAIKAQQRALRNQQRKAALLKQAGAVKQSRAGQLPAGSDPAIVEMMKKVYLQSYGVAPTAAGSSGAPVPQPLMGQPAGSEPAVEEKPAVQQEEKPARKPRHFFNRQE